MNNGKRFLSLLLSLVMLLSLFPASAFAAEIGESVGGGVLDVPSNDEPVGDDAPGVPELASSAGDNSVILSASEESQDAAEENEEKEDEILRSAQDDEDAPTPVRVIFVCEPEETVVTVYNPAQPDENGEPTVIDPEEDGSWLLVPGTYLYDAECEGYVSEEKVEFEVSLSMQSVDVFLPKMTAFVEKKKVQITYENELQGNDSTSYLWPAVGSASITSGRGWSSTHNGIDIAAASGTNVVATKSGTVVAIMSGCKNHSGISTGTCQSKGICNPVVQSNNSSFASQANQYTAGGCNWGFGNGVIIKHSDGTHSQYAHMTSVSVTLGQVVARGQVIGTVGDSGNANGAHLHFTLSTSIWPANNFNNNPSEINYDMSSVGGGSTTPTVANSGTYNNHFYERYDSSLTWTEAKAFCENKGGHLVTITSEAENVWITNTLLSGCGKNVYFIGGTDTSGSWKWVTGETFSYSNWDQDRPEPTNKANEDYAAIMGKQVGTNKSPGEWIDIYNDGDTNSSYVGYELYNCGFICEYESYTMHFNANGGTGSMSDLILTLGEEFTVPACGFTREGYTFQGGWNAKRSDNKWYVYGKGWFTEAEISSNGYTKEFYTVGRTPTFNTGWTGGDTSVSFTMYAVWDVNKLTIKYNANGGEIGPNNYNQTLGNGGVILRNGSDSFAIWNYGEQQANGLINDTTFGLTRSGYQFAGWSLSSDGSTTVYDQDASMKAETLYPGLKNGSATVTLYAIWTPLYYLDLNGYLDANTSAGTIKGFGTADVYINGSLVADDIDDYYVAWPAGTSYEIKDIKTADGKYYWGVTEGSLSGTISKQTSVRLHFSTVYSGGQQTIPDGPYLIAPASDTELVVHVAGDGSNGSNVALGSRSTSEHQLFDITYLGNGAYKIVDSQTGRALNIEGKKTANRANIQVWDFANNYNSQWVISESGNGAYNIIALYSGMYVDYPDGNAEDGTNICIFTGNGSASQKFVFISALAEYCVDYNANGGTDAPDSQTKTHDVALTLTDETPTRDGYSFLGWAESADAMEAQYQPGDTYTANADTTLYAVWAEIRTPGDATGDGKVNGFDLIRIRKALAGETVEINESNADVTGDGKFNGFDLIRLRKYLAGEPVELK